MKTAIFSDLHSYSPFEEVERLSREGIERFVFLGDYDSPHLFRDILALDKSKIVLLGNHETNLVTGRHFTSPYVIFEHAKKAWESYPGECAEAISMIPIRNGRKRGIRAIELVSGKRVAYLHGALRHIESLAEGVDPFVWGRIVEVDDLSANFNAMQTDNFWLLFRGHDHRPGIWSIPSEGYAWGSIGEHDERVVKIQTDRKYIFTVGAFREGHYGVFDSKKLEFERRTPLY